MGTFFFNCERVRELLALYGVLVFHHGSNRVQ